MAGAEDLIGRGDSLFLKSNGDLIRTQGAFMPDEEIEKMLVPYRMKVKPIRLDEAKETDGEGKSWFKTGLDTWNSLSKREKNTLIAGAGWLGGIIMGKLKSKKKK
jgi:DNA segregation ATPase FtsK/SpoIIIE-like protein